MNAGRLTRLRPAVQTLRRYTSAMRVKICGLTRPEDALASEAAGADAIGLNFAPVSKRFVSVKQAEAIVAPLGPFIGKVGVFVDAPMDFVLETAKQLELSAVQLHGNEDAQYAREVAAHVPVIKAVRFEAGLMPNAFADYPASALLLDGLKPGSGEAFTWEAATAWVGLPHLILAGGLTPETVAEGIRVLRPYAVDVASGVEAGVGLKDPTKLQDFVRAAKAASAA